MSKYSELLKDPRWQKKRLEILNRDSFKCTSCGDDKTELHVHHQSYTYGKNPWDYKDNNFVTLCKQCHEHEEILKTFDIWGSLLDSGFTKISVLRKLYSEDKVIRIVEYFNSVNNG